MNPHDDAMHSPKMSHGHAALKLRRLGIDTYTDPVIFMHKDCPVCRSEGFEARARVKASLGDRHIIATLHVVSSELLSPGEAGLSEFAWRALEASEGAHVQISHPDPVDSLSLLRAKVYGARLGAEDMHAIIHDVIAGSYSDLQLAAFVTATAGAGLDHAETIALTQAMLDAGERIRWDFPLVADKHSVGGLPGNRTTPLVVAIVAACGVPIPKTSSRAITSPAGTADTMEVLAPVDLDVPAIRRVVEREGGCIVWGGAVRLSPADDLLIRVERPLDFDSEGQLVASVLSKKAAAGSTHVVIDMPVGPSAKVRSAEAALGLSGRFLAVGTALGLQLRIEQTDGVQPVGRGIGPALEARDLLAVLQGRSDAPCDLRARALRLAGAVLELAGACAYGQGEGLAREVLEDGRAWRKFQAICEAQGGMREPPRASVSRMVLAEVSATVSGFDNRRLARLAKLAGAPAAPAAGLDLHVKVGDRVVPGQPLFSVQAEAPGELAYAMDYLASHPAILTLDPAG